MKTHKPINKKHITIGYIQEMETGDSIEDKVRQITETKAPIEAISPMIYTERKDGVRPEFNIRTDKWDIAQQAMDTIALGTQQKRAERISATADGQSKMNAPTTTSNTTKLETGTHSA